MGYRSVPEIVYIVGLAMLKTLTRTFYEMLHSAGQDHPTIEFNEVKELVETLHKLFRNTVFFLRSFRDKVILVLSRMRWL